MEGNDSAYGIERKSAILELLNKNARVDVQELSQLGAVFFKSVTFEPTYIEKEVQFQKEKRAIAKEAAMLIKNGV